MSTATAADEFKYNFFSAIKDLMATTPDTANVLVVYGYPDTYVPEDVIEFSTVSSVQSYGPSSGTNRSRDETLTLDVFITCQRGGGQEMELVCAQRAYQLLRMIETYARVTDTTIGGTVRWCFLTQQQSMGHTDPTVLEQGRVIEITATFTATARVSTS